jgi:hypothetical protein
MFKLQFMRVSAPVPGAPAWDSSPASAMDPAPFASVQDASAGQREIWAAMWRWLRGEAPPPPPVPRPLSGSSGGSAHDLHHLTATMVGSRREIERIGAGYTLGAAAGGGCGGSLAALLTLLREGAPPTRRAAMYGLAAAGDPAVPPLVALLQGLQAATPATTTAAEWSTARAEHQHTVICALMALGEASRTARLEAVQAIGAIITAWSTQLNMHVAARAAKGEVMEPDHPSMHRGLLTSGRSTGMSEVDVFATAQQRGIVRRSTVQRAGGSHSISSFRFRDCGLSWMLRPQHTTFVFVRAPTHPGGSNPGAGLHR